MICEKCKTDIPDTAKFCPKCGAKVEAAKPEALAKKCPTCGAGYPINVKFCKKDGTLLQDALPPKEEAKPAGVIEPKRGEAVIEPKIEKKPQEIKEPKDELLCPTCGTPYPLTTKFCKKDGTPLQKVITPKEEIRPPELKEIKPEAVIEPKVEEVAAEVKAEEKQPEKPQEIKEPKDEILCPTCGTPNPLTAKFCKKDGTPLKEEIKPSVIQPKAKVVAPPKAEIRKEAVRKPSRAWIWITVIVFVLITAGAGSYLYFSGIFGKSPEKLKEKINIELREKGLSNIFTDINKKWVATVTGSADNQTGKDRALDIVRQHKEIKDVIDNIRITRKPDEIEKDINKALRGGGLNEIYAQVDENFIATLQGSANRQDEKEKAVNIARAVKDIKDVRDNIQIIIVSPPPPPPPSADHYLIERNINNALRHAGLSNVYAEVNKDLIAVLMGSVNNQAEKSRALSIARSFREVRDVRENIQVRVAPPALPLPPISPPELEGKINRALRNEGLRGVTAEVNDNLEVTLKGSVGSRYEKDRAFEIAKTFKEAKRVRDVIFVVEQ